MKNTEISVVMPAYNGMPYLPEANNGILGQSFKNFEFIIVNDGTTDNSINCIKSFEDSRIKLINFEINQGDFIARNAGLKIANFYENG